MDKQQSVTSSRRSVDWPKVLCIILIVAVVFTIVLVVLDVIELKQIGAINNYEDECLKIFGPIFLEVDPVKSLRSAWLESSNPKTSSEYRKFLQNFLEDFYYYHPKK